MLGYSNTNTQRIRLIFHRPIEFTMHVHTLTNQVITGSELRPITADIYWADTADSKPVVVFAHGFRGFKDWGHWHLLAEYFAREGYCFVKFNFSHNGVTPEHLSDFVDLDAFAHNTFSKELNDWDCVLNWLENNANLQQRIQYEWDNLFLIGHSRGGGLAIIKGSTDKRVRAIASWAGVRELDFIWRNNPNTLVEWQERGVIYSYNTRTKQNMPLGINLYLDYQHNQPTMSVSYALQHLQKPLLVVHGDNDAAVSLGDAHAIQQGAPQYTKLHIIEGADHVFNGSHPCTAHTLPLASQQLAQATTTFFKQALKSS